MLCDWQIIDLCKESDVIFPFDVSNIGPCSLDIRLGDRMCWYDEDSEYIDPHKSYTYKSIKQDIGRQLIINPKEFILANTLETINLPRDIVATLTGRSSIGRLGILIHVTAGLIDPGYHGKLTLELYNLNDRPVILQPGDIIGQLTFERIDPCKLDYGEKRGRYQNDLDVNSSLFYQ